MPGRRLIVCAAWTREQALHWGCYMGRSMVVELLLRTDPDIDFRDAELRTPLHRAVQQAHALHLEIVLMLLARGAEVPPRFLPCLFSQPTCRLSL
jgi:ankyrin repeat protein